MAMMGQVCVLPLIQGNYKLKISVHTFKIHVWVIGFYFLLELECDLTKQYKGVS